MTDERGPDTNHQLEEENEVDEQRELDLIEDTEDAGDMDEADTANGEGPMEPVNDSESRYGVDESPA
jgi:hypothetical protein